MAQYTVLFLKLMIVMIAASQLFFLACHPRHASRRSDALNEPAASRDIFESLSLNQKPDSEVITNPPSSSRSPERPTNLRGNLDARGNRDWRYIVIHHSGTRSGSMAAFDRHAREARGWEGVGYHFVIGNGSGSPNGRIEVTFRWEDQMHGAHAGVRRYNQYGIGICLVGNFNNDRPTSAQMRSLVELTTYLQGKHNIPTSRIYGHRDVKSTDCPGHNFPFDEFIRKLRLQ